MPKLYIQFVTLALILVCENACFGSLVDLGNVVFIGDSITEANSNRPDGDGNYSWRYEFWKRTVDQGVSAQFVGSRTANAGGPTTYPSYNGQNFENRHEAIFGTRASERAATLSNNYSDLNQDGTGKVADTAFILVGCNDIRSIDPPTSQLTGVRDNIQSMVQGLRNANSSVDVFILSILPRFTSDTNGDGFKDLPDGRNDDYLTLNQMLANLAESESDGLSRTSLIDVSLHASPDWFYDGTHPNALGESRIGNTVFDFVATPEPSTILLFGLLSLGSLGRHRCRQLKVRQ